MHPMTRCGTLGRLLLGWSAVFVGALAVCSAADESSVCEDDLARQGIYLPYRFDHPFTPPTETLGADEAEAVLQRDWLFQAEASRWTSARLTRSSGLANWRSVWLRNPRTGDLTRELAELDALEQRLTARAYDSTQPGSTELAPEWIWFPEGRPAEHAPVEARYFRRSFDVPAEPSLGPSCGLPPMMRAKSFSTAWLWALTARGSIRRCSPSKNTCVRA
jgi:hypothetical protein